MKNKCHKKSSIWLIWVRALIITICLAVLTSCSSKESMKVEAVNVKKNQNSATVDGSLFDNEKNSFTKYSSLLGLNKEELIKTLNEKPNPVDEGGLEFKKEGLRIWFDNKSYTLVNQIFIMRNDIDLNGVKIGDNINSFNNVFGNPVSDNNGDAHFKYKNVFLSVNYDIKSGRSFGVYILRNDF